jgi:xanthine dehydrogenase accessory factor
MIKAKHASRIARLVSDREPFVLATVVHARRPTSVRPGDTAIVHRDGTIEGFVGGMCAESSVRLYSLRALETGEPLLLRLIPSDDDDNDDAAEDAGPGSSPVAEGAVVERNPCLSGGSLEIFLEPSLPDPLVIVVGGSPIADALAQLATAAGYAASRTPAAEIDDLSGAAALIVASHGNDEERILAAALNAGVPYVALVASPKRGTAVRAALAVPSELSAQLHTPAGLDIGARTPPEIAISILAELVAEHHAHPASRSAPASEPEHGAADPICGMHVAIAPATLYLDVAGARVYFCGPGCRQAYAAAHARDVAPS